jgi:hypothetical protein
MRAAPPFFPNPDEVHCMEAVLLSIVHHFEPAANLGWDDVKKITEKVPGKWSWPQFAMKNMLERGYQVERISHGSPQDIVDKGLRQYMIGIQGEEAAEKSLRMSVPAEEVENACRALLLHPKHQHTKRIPALKDIDSFLQEGFLVASMVNLRQLNGREGYAGHCVLVYGIDKDYVYMHDPGPEPFPERKVIHENYLAAATSPKPENWWIAAYKL